MSVLGRVPVKVKLGAGMVGVLYAAFAVIAAWTVLATANPVAGITTMPLVALGVVAGALRLAGSLLDAWDRA